VVVFDAEAEALAFFFAMDAVLSVFFTVAFGVADVVAEDEGDAVTPGDAGPVAAGSTSRSPSLATPGDAAAASGAFTELGAGDSVPPWVSPATRNPAPITTAVDPATKVYRKRESAETGTDIHLGESGQGDSPITMHE
jgi:hypothetical protein